MKVHVMTVGFTPQVFTAFIRQGADRVIAITSSSEDKRTREALEVLNRTPGLKGKIEEETPRQESFRGLVREMMGYLNSTSKDDKVFVHIGGGMRHMAAALLYATFFVDRRIQIVCTTRIGEGKKVLFEHETFPNLNIHSKLGESRQQVLNAINGEMKLVEIVEALNGDKKKNMPRVHRLLQKLKEAGLVEFNTETKKYSKTMAGEFAVPLNAKTGE